MRVSVQRPTKCSLLNSDQHIYFFPLPIFKVETCKECYESFNCTASYTSCATSFPSAVTTFSANLTHGNSSVNHPGSHSSTVQQATQSILSRSNITGMSNHVLSNPLVRTSGPYADFKNGIDTAHQPPFNLTLAGQQNQLAKISVLSPMEKLCGFLEPSCSKLCERVAVDDNEKSASLKFTDTSCQSFAASQALRSSSEPMLYSTPCSSSTISSVRQSASLAGHNLLANKPASDDFLPSTCGHDYQNSRDHSGLITAPATCRSQLITSPTSPVHSPLISSLANASHFRGGIGLACSTRISDLFATDFGPATSLGLAFPKSFSHTSGEVETDNLALNLPNSSQQATTALVPNDEPSYSTNRTIYTHRLTSPISQPLSLTTSSSSPNSSATTTTVTFFVCEVCGSRYRSTAGLRYHYHSQHAGYTSQSPISASASRLVVPLGDERGCTGGLRGGRARRSRKGDSLLAIHLELLIILLVEICSNAVDVD
ncbi:unnamed protein product [Protopolystoma xenopodis]|uniref:C2H2-type domain-containing protein n=1 Tax=Protopolystoma xenopodis TaxID=117903 RepID=A0A448XCW9_9PLAT|nr:unnamed protein product [Protopolystoma xenopodis]